MTDVSRLLRGTLPFLVALPVATAFALPASAARPAPAAQPTRAAQWWLAALQVPRAWRAAPEEGKGVTVAVLSTGVGAAHRDLSGAVTAGPDYSASMRAEGGPFWGFEGTAVASLIAGHGHGAHGADGITGVAPDARILSVRVTLEYDDPLNSDAAVTRRLPAAIAAGIRYAVAHGAGVIALPLDPGTLGPAASGDPAAAGGSAAERAAISYALGHGVVLIAPAGDNGASTGTVNYPAAYPGVVAVGATAQERRADAVHQHARLRGADRPGIRSHDGRTRRRLRQPRQHGHVVGADRRGSRPDPLPLPAAHRRRGRAGAGAGHRRQARTARGAGHRSRRPGRRGRGDRRGRHRRRAPGPGAERAARPAHPRGTPRHPPRDRAAGHGHGDPGRVGAAGRGDRGLRADRGAGGRARGERRAAPPRAVGTLVRSPRARARAAATPGARGRPSPRCPRPHCQRPGSRGPIRGSRPAPTRRPSP